MQNLRQACEGIACDVELSVLNLPRWMQLSAEHDITAALDRCCAFVANAGNFEAILRCACAQKFSVSPACTSMNANSSSAPHLCML